MTIQTEIHNKVVGDIVKSIIVPVVSSQGTPADVLVLTESVVMGVLLYICKATGAPPEMTDKTLDLLVEGIRQRLLEDRARDANAQDSN